MPADQGGFLIWFDEQQRAGFMREIRGAEEGFSDALSSDDWKVRQWEVCGLMFEPNVITHWALARKGKKVATGKVRVEFTEVAPTRIHLQDVEINMGPRLRRNIVRARSGVGGRVPPSTWAEMKSVLGRISPHSLATLERIERLRDQSRTIITRAGANIVAQQRDAVGLALDVFEKSGQLKRRTLQGWVPPDGTSLSSFLDGLQGVRTIEDQLIARDATSFPGVEHQRHTAVGAVFSAGGRTLEVLNVNRTAIETSLGVDLLYWHELFDAWTLVQYKSMESDGIAGSSPIYRPDPSFNAELGRMQAFRHKNPDLFSPKHGRSAYRLEGDGFFFKLCSRVQLEVLSETLLPGMYLSREFIETLLIDPATKGPREGRILTFDNVGRHITNTMFAELVRDGWVGTRGASSSHIAEIVREAISGGRAFVLARQRRRDARPNLDATLNALGL
jgi:hypothetical protein